MNKTRTLRHVAVALLLLVAFLFQGTWALAGTTGSVSGVVTDEAGAPVAGAAVKVTSASETASATTDAGGHFNFLALAPDTYTVSIEKSGYGPISYAGVTVFADQSQTLSFKLSKALKTIAKETATSAGSLVKAGTTSDVYAVNATAQKQTAVSSGGQNLDSAYSAIYTQPGVVTGGNGNFGFGQTFYIRGSSYSQAGYEFDGVPVNRAFDNYNANSLSTVGVSQTEIYTGGSPASAGSATLAGYINQTIKTGTYPGFGTLQGTVGYPGFRHGLMAEVGGASPDRRFSYYVALSGMNYIPNMINRYNGGDLAPDGSNQYGLVSLGQFFTGGSAIYGLDSLFLGAYSQRGPWTTCGANGAAPAGSSTAQDNALGFGAFPVCNSYAPLNAYVAEGLQYGTGTYDRENIFNFHFALPHKHDQGRDDVQVLFDNFGYHTVGYDNPNTDGSLSLLANTFAPWGGAGGYAAQIGFAPGSYPVYGGANSPYSGFCASMGVFSAFFGTNPCPTTGGSPLSWGDSLQVVGASFGQNATTAGNAVQNYYFPNSPAHAYQSGISPSYNSGVWNTGSILKLQYQKNWSSGYARLYGYTFYSDWLQNDPWGGTQGGGLGIFGIGYASSTDYELVAHTRGVSLEVADQFNDKNLLTLAGNYVTSGLSRWNNGQGNLTPGTAPAAMLRNGGQCYSYTANTDPNTGLPYDGSYAAGLAAGSPVSCLSYLAGQTLGQVSAQAQGTALPTPTGGAAAAGATWQMSANIGPDGNHSTVSPDFYTLSLTDDFRPTDKLDLNFGVRDESYTYHLAQYNDPESVFWTNVINQTACVDPLGLTQVGGGDFGPGAKQSPVAGQSGYPTNYTTNPGGTCGVDPVTGDQLYHPGQNGIPLLNLGSASSLTHSTLSPRFGFTYTMSPETVIRGSFGRYVQPTETAFEQVLTYTDGYNLARNLFNSSYYNIGLPSTVHDNPLQYSNNADLSLEHHFRNTDWSLKLTPFYRYTSNQLVSVPLPGGLAGGFNAATQRTTGLELAIQKGDPSRNGISGQLSYTYTHARIKYSEIQGSNVVTKLQSAMKSFFALTKTGGGAPCYAAGTGAADPTCAATSITNPYYNLYPGVTYSQFASTLDPNGWYEPYANYFPDGLGGGGDSSTELPDNAFAGFVAYKHNKFQGAVNFDLLQGTKYGSPADMYGLDPRTCSQNQGALFGNGSQLADYQSCGGAVAIPNPVTGTFDKLAGYTNPWEFNLGAQLSYDFTPRISGTLYVANLINRCFGGTSTAWSAAYKPGSIVCNYVPNGNYLDYTSGEAYNTAGAGYFYGNTPGSAENGTAGYPAVFNQAFSPANYGGLPLQLYFQLNIKI